MYKLIEHDMTDGKDHIIEMHCINRDAPDFPEVMQFESDVYDGRVAKLQIVDKTAHKTAHNPASRLQLVDR